jgi:hypothetical protein
VKTDPVEAASRPVDETNEEGERGGELFPKNKEEHSRLLNWALEQFSAADDARRPLQTRWERYYKLYRSWVARQDGDWHSKVFWPIVFYVIESIIPKMVAQLPTFRVEGLEPEDDEPAKVMEKLLDWAAGRSKMYEQLVMVYKSALKYGTGIAKVRHVRITKPVVRMEEQTEQMMMPMPVMDPDTGAPMMGLDGQPLTEDAPMGDEVGTGEYERVNTEVVVYEGPVTEFVDIFNFWPAPEATSMYDARYVIQRSFRDDVYVKNMLREGIWRMPPEHEYGDLWSGQTDTIYKLREETKNAQTDPTRKLAEIWEIWTDTTVMVVLNRCAIVRCDENPYEHGSKPFIRIVDYLQEGEFWGVGEIEPIEGMQDVTNALWNQRIDNVRLVLNRMFAFDPDNVWDMRDLKTRPGGGIRVRAKDMNPRDVIQWIDTPDVTGSIYQEVAEVERMTEKISAVNSYTGGSGDAASYNQTATGASIITEQGNSRFALKVNLAEMTGLSPLAEMYGSILQQFMPEEMSLRILNEDGQKEWIQVTAESLQGGFDYSIEAQSSVVTESVRKEQSMNLLQTFAQIMNPVTGQPLLSLDALASDVLDAFGIEDKMRYAPAPPPPPQPMLSSVPPGGGEMAPGPDGVGDPNQIMDMLAAAGQEG